MSGQKPLRPFHPSYDRLKEAMRKHLESVYKENSQLNILIERLPDVATDLLLMKTLIMEDSTELDSVINLNLALRRKFMTVLDLSIVDAIKNQHRQTVATVSQEFSTGTWGNQLQQLPPPPPPGLPYPTTLMRQPAIMPAIPEKHRTAMTTNVPTSFTTEVAVRGNPGYEKVAAADSSLSEIEKRKIAKEIDTICDKQIFPSKEENNDGRVQTTQEGPSSIEHPSSSSSTQPAQSSSIPDRLIVKIQGRINEPNRTVQICEERNQVREIPRRPTNHQHRYAYNNLSKEEEIARVTFYLDIHGYSCRVFLDPWAEHSTVSWDFVEDQSKAKPCRKQEVTYHWMERDNGRRPTYYFDHTIKLNSLLPNGGPWITFPVGLVTAYSGYYLYLGIDFLINNRMIIEWNDQTGLGSVTIFECTLLAELLIRNPIPPRGIRYPSPQQLANRGSYRRWMDDAYGEDDDDVDEEE